MHLLGRKMPQEEEEAQLASVDEENTGAASEDDEKVSASGIWTQALAAHSGFVLTSIESHFLRSCKVDAPPRTLMSHTH